MQRSVINELLRQLIADNINNGKLVRIDKNEDKLIFINTEMKEV